MDSMEEDVVVGTEDDEEEPPKDSTSKGKGHNKENKVEAKGKENKTLEKKERLLRLPLARVKNIMKLDPESHNISQDAAFLTTKAAELFIETLSKSVIDFTSQTKRKTVMMRDLEKTVSTAPNLCFLDGMLEPNN